MNLYSEFFFLDISAHFTSMIVRCALVWDKTNNALSLPDLARDKRVLDPSRSHEDKELVDLLEGYKKDAQGILALRNMAVAHVNVHSDRKEIFRQAGVAPDTIPLMLEKWRTAINLLRQRINSELPEVVFCETPLNELRRLVHCLGGPDLSPDNPLDGVVR